VRSNAFTAAVCGAVLAIAGLAEAFADCLDNTQPAFFSTCAQVAPILALALFVDLVLVLGPVLTERTQNAPPRQAPPEHQAFRALVRANVGMLVISEASALYAVGARASTTFLTICAVLPWCAQLLLLVSTTYYRGGVHRIGKGRK
jgi:hypothetical protein